MAPAPLNSGGRLFGILQVLGSDRRNFTATGAVAEAAGVDAAEARRLLSMMVARQLAESPRPGQWRATAHGVAVLTAADRPARAPKGAEGLRGRFWNVLRKLKKTDVAQLVTMAGAGNEKNPEHNARLYLKALTDAGYLTRMKRRGPHGEMTYALVRDSGPRAPIVSHRKQTVTDPNNGEVHHV